MLKSIVSVSLIAAVSAHQNLHQFWINDKTPGRGVGIRFPPSNSPVTDVNSNDIVCNVNGAKVPSGVETIAANAGDTVKVQWDQSTHPGPITHMLFGPVDDASRATGIGAGWFKIDEQDFVGGKWANEIMSAEDMTRTFKLPQGLKSGEYLLRSEMLALHASQTKDGAQFYIGCIQLKITGSGSGDCGPKITLPGAYSADDKNIYIPNFYYGFDPTTYTAPGGPVATCGAGSGPGPVTSATSAAPSKPATTLVTTTSKAATSSDAQPAEPTGAPVPLYGQCGGMGWTGSTVCVEGAKCLKSNDYYSQCVQA